MKRHPFFIFTKESGRVQQIRFFLHNIFSAFDKKMEEGAGTRQEAICLIFSLSPPPCISAFSRFSSERVDLGVVFDWGWVGPAGWALLPLTLLVS